ncbi:MAG: DNA polymerase III subunit beta [Clostridiales bacterium]|jgi:DNA polymerase-3 subunit beta|nr:DNA polymerase III subunit beta [Clostridiales bacterium]
MKIVVNKEILLENLAVVSKAVSTRTPKPILECVLLKAHENLRVYGNDLELGIESADISAEILEEGEIALEAKILLDITRKMPEGYISIETDKSNLVKLKSGRTEFKVMGFPGDEYPFPEPVSKNDGFEINALDLKDMIRQTIFSVGMDDSKPVLTGELLQIKDGYAHMVAVDGFRVSYRRSTKLRFDPQITSGVVVPAKSLSELARILPLDGDSKLHFYFTDRHIMFELERFTLISRLIDGEFIRYNQIFNEDFSTLVNISGPELLLSLERVSLIVKDNKKSPVKLSIGQDVIQLSSNAEIGVSYDEIAADIDGNPLVIAFNPRFLIEALRSIGDEKVLLTFTGALSPCIIKGVDNCLFKYLILPIRIKG